MITVLVVDDEFSIALLAATILEDEGYRVFTAANGRQALERIAENRPSLIVSDFMMPVMDGAALGRIVRDTPEYRDIAIIMSSGLPEASVREKFSEFDAFLRKPFFESALLEAVAQALEDRASARPQAP